MPPSAAMIRITRVTFARRSGANRLHQRMTPAASHHDVGETPLAVDARVDRLAAGRERRTEEDIHEAGHDRDQPEHGEDDDQQATAHSRSQADASIEPDRRRTVEPARTDSAGLRRAAGTPG